MAEQARYLFGADARVLLLLLEHDMINRSAFQEKYKVNYISAKNALYFLKELGLTAYDEKGDFRDTQVWFLTEKGKVVARRLSELMTFIENKHPDP